MKKVLIIGGSGFIGRNFVEFLNKNCSDKYELSIPSSRELDLTDEHSIINTLETSYYDIIFYFGHYSAFNHPELNEEKALFYNLHAFEIFLVNNHRYGRMFFAGSGAEYDKRYDIISVKEGEVGKTIPCEWYGVLKYTIGRLIENSDNVYNLRIFGLFGKYEYYPTKFISGICAKAVMGVPFTIRQNVYFDYLWIDDFCKMILKIADKEVLNYHTYNIVSGKKISLLKLCGILNEITGNTYPIYICKEGLAKEYTASNERFIQEFGPFTYTEIEDAVRCLYNWYLENKDMISLEKILY